MLQYPCNFRGLASYTLYPIRLLLVDDVEKVKSRLDIVEIIGEHLQLKKAGRNFKTNCPFHGEKTPSFVVSSERQIWHCFGCHRGGDLFTFIQDYENITFADALKDLAARAGVKLTTSPARSDREKKRDLIYSLNHLSAQFYNYLLLSHPVGKKALKYLTEDRKLTIPLIKTFNLGFAPGTDALAKFLIGKKKYKEDELLLAGLVYQRGRYVSDFFKERIIFPIYDHRGNVVAFSGRGMNAEITPKYVNTKETLVYVKGDTLFGLNLAKEGIKKDGKVIIVEGEFDVITAHKEGILNIVAVKGTALTENQIKLLKRITSKFAFCFDTDPAGTEAQRRSIKMIDQEGITATVITIESGKDPDEILNENPLAFKKAVKNDRNVFDFIIDSAIENQDPKSVEGKKEILAKTLSFLAAIENRVIREHYLKKLADRLSTSLDAVTQEAEKLTKPTSVPAATPAVQLPREEILEIYLLSLIFQSKNPKKILSHARTVLAGVPLTTPSLEKVLVSLEKYEQQGTTFDPADFAKVLPSELHVPFDTSYLSPIPEFSDETAFEKELGKIAKQVRISSVKKKLDDLGLKLAEAEKNREEDLVTHYQKEFEKYSQLLSTN